MMHNFHNFFFLDYYYCYWCCCSLSTHFASQWIFKITQLVQLSNCILWWILIDLYWIWIKTTNTLPTFKPIFEWNIILIIHVFSISILTQKILIAFASTTLKFKYRSRIQYNTSKQMMMRCLLFFPLLSLLLIFVSSRFNTEHYYCYALCSIWNTTWNKKMIIIDE